LPGGGKGQFRRNIRVIFGGWAKRPYRVLSCALAWTLSKLACLPERRSAARQIDVGMVPARLALRNADARPRSTAEEFAKSVRISGCCDMRDSIPANPQANSSVQSGAATSEKSVDCRATGPKKTIASCHRPPSRGYSPSQKEAKRDPTNKCEPNEFQQHGAIKPYLDHPKLHNAITKATRDASTIHRTRAGFRRDRNGWM
jgi:hypothetical protein